MFKAKDAVRAYDADKAGFIDVKIAPETKLAVVDMPVKLPVNDPVKDVALTDPVTVNPDPVIVRDPVILCKLVFDPVVM